MSNLRYTEVETYPQLVDALGHKNTFWLLLLGNGDWTNTAIEKAKEQVTDQPQFMALWVKALGIFPQGFKVHLMGNDNDVAACGLAKNLGVAGRVNKTDAQKGARLGKLLHQAEAYTGPGFCLTHGAFNGATCTNTTHATD